MPPPATDTWAVIPAYNAATTVGDVVRDTARLVPHVVVVDDGSRDGTAEVAREAGALVVAEHRNHGKGAALRIGFRLAAQHGATRVVTLDADGQHLAREIPKLLAAADADPRAIVVGERNKAGHAISRKARFGNWVADTLLRRFAGRPLPDTQCGFRVYPLDVTLALGAAGDRYEFESEVLLRAAHRGVPIVGVPVDVHYPPPEERVSNFRPFQDTLRIIRMTVATSMGR
jgi:glycosyltransferase involved in cell wall biosynthesis